MSKEQMRKDTENSETFLKSVLKNSDGFTTPKNYFSELDDSLELKVFEKTIPKKTGFSIPKDYLENIESKALKRVSSKTAKKGRVIQLKKIQPWISIAAVFVISLSVSIFYLSSKTETITFDDIAQSDIEYWINNNSDFMTTIELETVLKGENLEETNFDFTEISSDDIEDYLLNENDIDIYTEI